MTHAFLSDRAVLSVAGEDARTFLQSLVTCDVETLHRGDAAFGALLTPQGKILFDFFVVCATETEFLLDTDAALAPALAKRLAMYKLRAKVVITTTDKRVVAVWHDDGVPSPFAFPDPRADALGTRVIVDSVEDAGDPAAYDAHRIACGLPKERRGFRLGRRVSARNQHGPAPRRVLYEGLLRRPGGRIAHAASRHRPTSRPACDIRGCAAPGWRGGSRG